MTNTEFDPGRVLGNEIINLSRQELCELVSKLCRLITAEVGTRAFRGGVYPDNISLSEAGEPALGPARQEGWEGQELKFIAPELYWNGKRGPESDVYSLGLLMYYALNKGLMPYEEDCDNPQLRRMNGEDFPAPRAAGRRLGAIIEKATHFNAAYRYRSLEELQIMLDNCLKNNYLDGAPSSQAIFKKDDSQLSEIERMMVGIIDRGDDEPEEEIPEAEEKAPEELCPEEAVPEAAGEPVLTEEPEKSPEPEKKETAQSAAAAEISAIDALLRSEKTGEPLSSEEPEKPQPAEEPEKIKVYEPSRKKPVKKPAAARQPVPILTEEKNPELQPVIPRTQTIKPAVQYGKSAERERKIAEQVKRRKRRPMIAVLVICAVIIVTAIVAHAMLNDFAWQGEDEPNSMSSGGIDNNLPPVNEDIGIGIVAVPTAPPVVQEPEFTPNLLPKEHRYQVIKEDISWISARDRALELGGYLVTINSQEELDKVIALAQEAGISRLWIGCHRINDTLVWENGEMIDFYPQSWGQNGEPSYYDSYDGTPEDYLMLWHDNGWSYNDSRNDPMADYSEWYTGTMGFVVEFNE